MSVQHRERELEKCIYLIKNPASSHLRVLFMLYAHTHTHGNIAHGDFMQFFSLVIVVVEVISCYIIFVL